MTWAQAQAHLESLLADVGDLPSDAALAAALVARPDAAEAAIAIFLHAYVYVDSDMDRRRDQPDVWTALASALVRQSAALRARFVAEVLFAVAAPGAYGELARRAHTALPTDELVQALVAALDGDDQRRAANALRAQYYLFGRPEDPRLDVGALDAIASAVARLRARAGDEDVVAAALEGWTLPSNAL